MYKKLLSIFIMCFAVIFVFVSCGKKIKNTEEIINYLKDLDSYSCNVNIRIENDKQKINYTGKQLYDKKYGKRFELGKDRLFIYKQNKIFASDLSSGSNYNIDEDFDSLFKFCFIDEYVSLIYTNERVDNSFKNIYNEKYQVISLDIPGNNKNMCKAELYINAVSSVPRFLMIYNSNGEKMVNVEYTDFKSNIELKKDIFNIGTVYK
ncbi:germination lipoprotein GerS-related protein [Clostridium tyrobutyricum]|uniref:germination lipoprotein GerS-related protein n=1 Tax=Clostridium tyrobutyricum TaxID=1519 RepID=UPI0039F6BB10